MPFFSRRRRSWSSSDYDSDDSDDSEDSEDYRFLPESKLMGLTPGWTSSSASDTSSRSISITSNKPPSNVLTSDSNISKETSSFKTATPSATAEAVSESGLVMQDPLPNWDALLFGGNETSCQEILTYPECDTYIEDCNLARDASLDFLSTSYHIPVFNSLRNCNQTQVNSALRSLHKACLKNNFVDQKEELLVYVLMLDYLTCCCQEGSLFPLYEKCKDDRKRLHIKMIDADLRMMVDVLKSKTINLKQLYCLEKFVLASLDRIPKTLGMNSFSVKFALERMIKLFEVEEKKKQENSEYNFDDASPEPPSKKYKPSTSNINKKLVATSNNWRERPIFPDSPDVDDVLDKSHIGLSKAAQTSTSIKETGKFASSIISSSSERITGKIQAVKTSKNETNELIKPVISSNDTSLVQKKKIASPYKSKKLAWNSKYVSPSKQTISKNIVMNQKALDQRSEKIPYQNWKKVLDQKLDKALDQILDKALDQKLDKALDQRLENMSNSSQQYRLSKDNNIGKPSQAAVQHKSLIKVNSNVSVRNEQCKSPVKVRKQLVQSVLKFNVKGSKVDKSGECSCKSCQVKYFKGNKSGKCNCKSCRIQKYFTGNKSSECNCPTCRAGRVNDWLSRRQ